jgi:hypothetical protein
MFAMNSLRSTGLSSMKVIESSSTRTLQTITHGDTSMRKTIPRFFSSVRQPFKSRDAVFHSKNVHRYQYCTRASSLRNQHQSLFTNRTTTSMLASTVARRFASRVPPQACFSTVARSQPPRSLTPLLAAAGVAALSMAIATREVRSIDM